MSTQSKLRGNSYAKWKVRHDYLLWLLRDEPIKELADKFERTNGSISRRLEHLRDPNHEAHKRLFAKYVLDPVPSKVRCKKHHGKLALAAELKRKDIKLNFELKLDNKGEKWKEIDDDCLWTHRDVSYELLAKHHGRTVGAIRKRLELLAERRASKSKLNNVLAARSNRNQCIQSSNRNYSAQQSRKRPREQQPSSQCYGHYPSSKRRRLNNDY